jgi:hypothetical protein
MVHDVSVDSKYQIMPLNDGQGSGIMIHLTHSPFLNWFVMLSDIKLQGHNLNCQISIERVPNDVTDKQIDKLRKKFTKLMQEIMQDLVKKTVDRLENQEQQTIT